MRNCIVAQFILINVVDGFPVPRCKLLEYKRTRPVFIGIIPLKTGLVVFIPNTNKTIDKKSAKNPYIKAFA